MPTSTTKKTGVTHDVLDEAAQALSAVLRLAGVRHAFCGGYLAMLFGVPDRTTRYVDCIIEGGLRDAISALNAHEDFEVPPRLATGATTVFYKSLSGGPKTRIELLKAGEFGPVALKPPNTIDVDGLRCLSPTEFVRSKVKAWVSRRAERDRCDVLWVLETMGGLDVDRINPDEGLDDLAKEYREVAMAWSRILGKDCGEEGKDTEDGESDDDNDVDQHRPCSPGSPEDSEDDKEDREDDACQRRPCSPASPRHE